MKSAEGIQDMEWLVVSGTARDRDRDRRGHTDPEQIGWNES